MKPNRTSTGLLLLVVAAGAGFLMLYLPPQLMAQYQVIREMGGAWVAVYLGVVGTGAALLLTATLWTVGRLWWRSRRKTAQRQRRDASPSALSGAEKQREIDENLAAADRFQADVSAGDPVRGELDGMIRQLERKRKEQILEIVAFGTISSGKSSLLNALAGRAVFATDPRGGTTLLRNEIPWPGIDRVRLVDTPGLGEIDGEVFAEISATAAADADLVLLVLDGPLRDAEFRLLKRLGEMEKRILVCLNKEDWHEPPETRLLLRQLAAQTEGLVDRADIVAVRAFPGQRRRIRRRPDGTEIEELVDVPPDISALGERMLQVVQRDGRDMLLANLLLQSRGLVESARRAVEAAIDQRARELIDRYMWGAGGAAALSPLPVVDLVVCSAVTAKMVVDLARVYHQEMDFQAAVHLLGQLGKNLLGILGTSAAAPAVTAAVASLLKTVPGIGTIAGGALQGLVQALITRWIGGVFMVYFKSEMRQPEGGLTSLAHREWQRVTTAAELGRLVQAAREHFRTPNGTAP